MSYQEAWREPLLIPLHEESPRDETDFVEAGLVQAVLGLDDTEFDELLRYCDRQGDLDTRCPRGKLKLSAAAHYEAARLTVVKG